MGEESIDFRAVASLQNLDDAEVKIRHDLAQNGADSAGDGEIFIDESADEEIGFHCPVWR